ncbi:hypothetical protein, partial [Paracoccus sp. MC1854]|uniref:hypothetical protein n=1 Tax=Paracoccus sp. MC1854 TaxID=2760306 RepID=UPI001C71D013
RRKMPAAVGVRLRSGLRPPPSHAHRGVSSRLTRNLILFVAQQERFNGRIEDVLQSHRFHSGEDLEQTILRLMSASATASCPSLSSRVERPSTRSRSGIAKNPNCSESSRIITRDVTGSSVTQMSILPYGTTGSGNWRR